MTSPELIWRMLEKPCGDVVNFVIAQARRLDVLAFFGGRLGCSSSVRTSSSRFCS